MRIERPEIESGPNVEGPHPNRGRLVITQEDEKSHNLFALFIENVWMNAGDDTFNVGFSPGLKEATLWVSGSSTDVVKEVLDETLETLKGGFSKKGLDLEIVRTDSSQS